jgi:anti-sigma B factor antagonist
MNIEHHTKSGWHVVAVEGEVDIATAGQLDAAIEEGFQQAEGRLAIDLSQVSFMDSTGLRSMIAALHAAGEGTRLVVVLDGGPVRRLFEIAGVADAFEIVEDVDSVD